MLILLVVLILLLVHGQLVNRRLLKAGQQVGVGVQGLADSRVPEPLLDHLCVKSIAEAGGRHRMSQAVKAHSR